MRSDERISGFKGTRSIEMEKLIAFIRLMRIKHYVKNALIFLPLFFDGSFFNLTKVIQVLAGFISFSLLASVIYAINDILDIEKDRNHEKKRERPLARGEVDIPEAIGLAAFLLIMALIVNGIFNNQIASWLILGAYFTINLGYSMGLKNVPLLDVFIIVMGFMLRILLGGVLIRAEITDWMYLTILSLSFFLALGKRRNEIRKVGQNARTVLKYYSVGFLDKMMYICLGLTIIFYSLWSVAPNKDALHGNQLIWTVPLVLMITMKYSMIIEGDSHGDPADVIFSDKYLLGLIALFIIFLGAIYYLDFSSVLI